MSDDKGKQEAAVLPLKPSFWLIAALILLWNGLGAYDFVMTESRNPAYIAHLPEGFLARLDAQPWWALAAWALGVWASFAGSVLLVIRHRIATPLFLAGLIGAVVGLGWQFIGGTPPTPALAGLVICVATASVAYGARCQARGWLR